MTQCRPASSNKDLWDCIPLINGKPFHVLEGFQKYLTIVTMHLSPVYLLHVLGLASQAIMATACHSKPTPEAPHMEYCGIHGRLLKPREPFISGNTSTIDRCGHACLKYDNCVSFEYTVATKLCSLMNTTIAAQHAINKTINFGETFFDVSLHMNYRKTKSTRRLT